CPRAVIEGKYRDHRRRDEAGACATAATQRADFPAEQRVGRGSPALSRPRGRGQTSPAGRDATPITHGRPVPFARLAGVTRLRLKRPHGVAPGLFRRLSAPRLARPALFRVDDSRAASFASRVVNPAVSFSTTNRGPD